jgi:hypothetical protein
MFHVERASIARYSVTAMSAIPTAVDAPGWSSPGTNRTMPTGGY